MKTQIQKFKILMLFLVSATLLSSCSSDDDSGPSKSDLLSNKWYLVQQEDLSTTPPTFTVADACEQNSYFNFLEDGDLFVVTFYLDGSDCVSSGIIAATYALSDDGEQIYLTAAGDPPTTQAISIITLTSSELVLGTPVSRIYFER